MSLSEHLARLIERRPGLRVDGRARELRGHEAGGQPDGMERVVVAEDCLRQPQVDQEDEVPQRLHRRPFVVDTSVAVVVREGRARSIVVSSSFVTERRGVAGGFDARHRTYRAEEAEAVSRSHAHHRHERSSMRGRTRYASSPRPGSTSAQRATSSTMPATAAVGRLKFPPPTKSATASDSAGS